MVKCIMICDVLVCCNNKDILPHRSLRLPRLKTARGRSITFDIQVTGICAEKKHKLQNSVSSTMRRDTMSTWPDTESGLGHDISVSAANPLPCCSRLSSKNLHDRFVKFSGGCLEIFYDKSL